MEELDILALSTNAAIIAVTEIWLDNTICDNEDCVKRDVRKAGEEEDWKKKTRDRVGWKRLSDEAVKKLRAAPHP